MPESSESFLFDVFLSHSSNDKPVVREVANRLKSDGLKVWLDEWEIQPGDNIPSKIEHGLEFSRVLVLCMSANAFGSDWAQLEAGTFRFRDPLNKERRFIPLKLDDASIRGSLAQFLYIDWRKNDLAYPKLFEACRPPPTSPLRHSDAPREYLPDKIDHEPPGRRDALSWAFSPDLKRALAGYADGTVRLWNVTNKKCIHVLTGNHDQVWHVAWSPDGKFGLSSCRNSIWLWDLQTGQRKHVFEGHTDRIGGISWSFDQHHMVSCSDDGALRLWDMEQLKCVSVIQQGTKAYGVEFSRDGRFILSGSRDASLKLWDVTTEHCIRVLEGHTGEIRAIQWSVDQIQALTSGGDGVIRLWDVQKGRCLQTLKGHGDFVWSLAWSPDGKRVLSGGGDKTARLWDLYSGVCLATFEAKSFVRGVAWSADAKYAYCGTSNGTIKKWNISKYEINATALKTDADIELQTLAVPAQIQYTNAKVLLVGESGAGKTGLSKRLAANDWQPSDSTVGAWASQWKLPVESNNGVEREIWLWDFGGQADQRLIHQLYMDDTALAVLVFDGQKEDVFETLGQWDRDLTRASRQEFAKLLVAGRVDAGSLRVSRAEIERFSAERKFNGFLETSAKTNTGCAELKEAILAAISWDNIPCRTTEVLFKRLKEEIIHLKDEGRVLMRFNELRETLQIRMSGDFQRFADEELRAVLTLLAGPGVVWELQFGSWVLLQPERINAYAQAVIRTLQADEHERGCLAEENVLRGDLLYQSSMERLNEDEERFVLLAMLQMLVMRGLCFRQATARGNLLIFPSYYRRERPEQVNFPAVLVTYRFSGFLDEIYATLVVRLHHCEAFHHGDLWRYAADFHTNTGQHLGVKLIRLAPGKGELEVYFDATVSIEEKIIFSKYVHEHLLQHAREVERLRQYACKCGTPVGNREVAMKRLDDWLQGTPAKSVTTKSRKSRLTTPTIICVSCEERVNLWDDMEKCFASEETLQRVREMQEETKIELDNESKERALVGEVISTVALAAQISRELVVSDHGIDMEIEFKNELDEATGKKLYLQLKSGDSYIRTRKRDQAEVFPIKDQRHVTYWISQKFPVLLVIRNSYGDIRWMEISEYLRIKSENGQKEVREIIFKGERFDVMSVRRWREQILKL